MDMEGLTNFVSMLDYILDSQRKRHIVGGIPAVWWTGHDGYEYQG